MCLTHTLFSYIGYKFRIAVVVNQEVNQVVMDQVVMDQVVMNQVVIEILDLLLQN